MDWVEITEIVKGGASALDAVLQAVKSAKEIAKKPEAERSRDARLLEQSLDEALDQMLAVKQAQLGLLYAVEEFRAERRAFEAERDEFKKFKAQADDYALVALAENSFARALKPELRRGEAHPYFCADCFEKAKLSMLHFEERAFYFDTLKCRECNGTVRAPNDNRPTVHVVKRKSGWDFFD